MAKASSKAESSGKQETPFVLLFPDFESEMASTRRMLERIPDGNDDWRPHPKSRSLGELAGHVAQLPGFGLMMATRDEFDALASRTPEAPASTTAERLQMFDQLSAQLRGVLRQMTWDQGAQSWTLRLGDRKALVAQRTTVLRTAFMTHLAHHRAQLGVYLRMLDVAVPWTYGRSADEEPPAIP
jgi:uncharacterized damage-inducible protein DinB